MPDDFSFETAIKDGMSGPAQVEVAALKRLEQEIGSTEKAIRNLQGLQLKYKETGFKGVASQAGLEIQKLRLHLGDLKKEQSQITPKEEGGGVGEMLSHLVPQIAAGEILAEGVKKTAEFALEAAKSVVEIGVEGVKFAVEMSEFRENAEHAFEAVLGTKEQADRAFEGFEDIGRRAHMPVERAEGLAQDLMLQGEENVSTISNVLTAVADLNRVGLERGAAKLQSIIERSLAQGAFVLPKKLGGLGVQLPLLYEDLAKRLHKSVTQVKSDLTAGKIDAETGIAALTSAITEGHIGEVAAKKLDLKDIGTDLSNDVKAMFEGVDVSPLMRGLDTLKMLFEDEDGSVGSFKSQVTGVFNDIVKWVGDATTEMTKLGLHFEIGFLDAEIAVKPLLDDIRQFSGQTDVLETLGHGAEMLGEGLVKAAVGAFWLVTQVERLREKFDQTTLRVGGHEVGTGLIEGMVDAITGGTYGVVKAVAGLGEAAIDEAKSILGIKSPSKVMMEVGANVTEGFALGIEGGKRRTDDAVGFAMPSAGDAAVNLPDFSGLAAAGGGGGGVTVAEGAIKVEIHTGTTTATKEDIQEITEHAMADAIERLVLEIGG